MSVNHAVLGEAGLQFFGRITASISHEIRNVLAVLNENAGLMSDYVQLAEKGIPLDPERIKALAGSMGTQIRRADGIVENMNRFAHAVDERIQSVDVNEIVGLVVALSGRLADMKGVTVETVCENDPIELSTNPFFLENLLWCFLDFAMETVGDEKNMRIISEADASGIRIRFAGLEKLGEINMEGFPSRDVEALLASVEADFSLAPDGGEIVIRMAKQAK